MVMSAIGIVDDNPDPSHDEIRHALEGNICCCTGYHNIVLAIEAAVIDNKLVFEVYDFSYSRASSSDEAISKHGAV